MVVWGAARWSVPQARPGNMERVQHTHVVLLCVRHFVSSKLRIGFSFVVSETSGWRRKRERATILLVVRSTASGYLFFPVLPYSVKFAWLCHTSFFMQGNAGFGRGEGERRRGST